MAALQAAPMCVRRSMYSSMSHCQSVDARLDSLPYKLLYVPISRTYAPLHAPISPPMLRSDIGCATAQAAVQAEHPLVFPAQALTLLQHQLPAAARSSHPVSQQHLHRCPHSHSLLQLQALQLAAPAAWPLLAGRALL